jgi:hypothetical protein
MDSKTADGLDALQRIVQSTGEWKRDEKSLTLRSGTDAAGRETRARWTDGGTPNGKQRRSESLES